MADLSALIARCREASEAADAACDDYYLRDYRITTRDAAYRALGAEWAAIGELLADHAANVVTITASTRRLQPTVTITRRDRTGGQE